jgi:hypothetical protein
MTNQFGDDNDDACGANRNDVDKSEKSVSFTMSSKRPPRKSRTNRHRRTSETKKDSKRMSALFTSALFSTFQKKGNDDDDRNDSHCDDNDHDNQHRDGASYADEDERSVLTGGLVLVAEDDSGLGFSMTPVGNQNNQRFNRPLGDTLPIEIGGPDDIPSLLAPSNVPNRGESTDDNADESMFLDDDNKRKKSPSVGIVDEVAYLYSNSSLVGHSSEHFNNSRRSSMISRVSFGLPSNGNATSDGTLVQVTSVSGGNSTVISSRLSTSIHYFSDDSEED